MNYLAHGREHLDRPYALAGTALPDWLRVLGRKHRLPHQQLPAPAADDDSPAAELIRGVHRHYHDDAWFHATEAFRTTTRLVSERIRAAFPEPFGVPRPRHIRASFFGHILVEMLLDSWIVEQDPSSIERYYETLAAVDEDLVHRTAEPHVPEPILGLTWLIDGFRNTAFLRTYVDDDEVRQRLSQVAKRVRLPRLPRRFAEVVTWSRAVVREHGEALLTEPPAQ